MTQRLLSTAVQIKPAPTHEQLLAAALGGQRATALTPTDAEMRDALAQLVRDLDDMRAARTAGEEGWTVVDGSFAPTVNTTAEGEVILRGGIIIERPD